jgi:hypothetical protein
MRPAELMMPTQSGNVQVVHTMDRPRVVRRNRNLLWQVLAFGSMTFLLAIFTFTAVFYAMYRGLSGGSAPDIGDGLITAGSRSSEGWEDGNALPPAWAEQSLIVDAEGVRVVGVGRGETTGIASERSRTLAMYRLVQYIGQRVASREIGAAIGPDPGDSQADAITNQLLADVGGWMTPRRVNDAVKPESGGFTVATQHQIDKATIDRVIAFYEETEAFRGIVVGRRFPWSAGPSRLMVVSAESWFTGVSPGDPLVQIGRTPVTTIEDFVRVAPAAWRETPEGGTLLMWVEHEGKRDHIDFVRPSAAKRESKFELLPLDLSR